MNLSKGNLITIASAVAVAGGLAFGAFVNRSFAIDEWRTATRSVALGDVTASRVSLKMEVGNLDLSGGSAPGHLFDADFTYNVDDWTPVVDYEVVGARGALHVEQNGASPIFPWWRDTENHWNVRLNDDVPIDLAIALGVGDSEVILADLNVTDLAISAGIGESTIDLSDVRAQDLDVRIDGSIGDLTLILPRHVDVRVAGGDEIGAIASFGLTANDGIYAHRAARESAAMVDVTLAGGIDRIDLELAQ